MAQVQPTMRGGTAVNAMSRKGWGALAGVLLCAAGAAYAYDMGPAPDKDAPLHARIGAFDALVHRNHLNEWQYLPCVIFPPAGDKRPIIGNHEDVAGHTAMYLAALAHKYAVTQDPAVRKQAGRVMDAILRLEQVTGVPGVCARGFYKTKEPRWHEQAFFFPMEWHASETMPGYRWQGDLSSDKFTDFIYGVGTYWELCADEKQKQVAADFIDRFIGRCVDFNFKLVDFDDKMTLWGNFCPDLPHENLNALEMLAGLKVAFRLTGKPRYQAAYQRLIDEYHYDDEAILAKVLWPEEWQVSWDDHLAAKALYMLMRWETDPDLLQKYRMSLNRHMWAWRKLKPGHVTQLWYIMLYQALTGEPAFSEAHAEAMREVYPLYRAKGAYTIPGDDGPRRVESEQEEIPSSLFRTYWFGRHYGLIDAAW